MESKEYKAREEKKRSVFYIRGGSCIKGKIRAQGNKNEALPAISASLLSRDELILRNVPLIEDVHSMQSIVESLGLKLRTSDKDKNQLHLHSKDELDSKLPLELCSKLRASLTLAGPLLARNGEVFLPHPGGDRIGRRRLDTHFLALEALGAKVKSFRDGFELRCKKLLGADVLLDEASVTATENTLCAAVLAEGKSVIRNAASEPHVQGLCRLLNSMGAKIEAIGSNTLHIEGVESLHGAEHLIGSDYLEVGSFIALSAVTGGELRIEQVNESDVRMIRMIFARLGIQTHFEKGDLLVPRSQSMEIINDSGDAVPRIDSAPWPGFPADMSSVALVTATQCKGTVLVHEKMFESRLFFTDRLTAMGARIVLCDPHRAVIMGPTRLQAADLSSPDIRAGMALLIAALCAEGLSRIQNVIQIDRGFMNLDERLQALGADIRREE